MADNIELMRSLGIPDASGSAAVASGSASASPERAEWAAPQVGSNTNMQQVQAQQAYENIERSRFNALTYGWNGTVLNGLLRTYNAPVYLTDPKYTFEQKKQDVFQSDIVLSDERAKRLFSASNAQEVADLTARYKDEDYKAKSAEAYMGMAMLGGVPDIDLAIPVIGKVIGSGLKGASLTTRLMGLAGTAERLESAGKFASSGANVLFGDISTSRTWNAVANMGIGAATMGAADALSDEKVTWQQYATGIGLSGLAGFAFPGHAADLQPRELHAAADVPRPLSSSLESTSATLVQDVKSLGKVVGAPEVAASVEKGIVEQLPELVKPSEFGAELNKSMRRLEGIPLVDADPAELAKLSTYDLAVYGIKQARDRLSRAHTGAAEERIWEQVGAEAGSKFHFRASETAMEIAPEASKFAGDVQSMWSKLFPDSRLIFSVEDQISGNKAARGGFTWAGENTGIVRLQAKTFLRDPAKAMEVVLHEVGHGVTIKLLGNALKNGDEALLEQYIKAFTRDTEHAMTDASGSVLPGDLMYKRRTEDLGAAGLYGIKDVAELRKYYHSPLEWLAQQFAKSAEQVIKEAKIGTGSTRTAAMQSALFKSMPEAAQDLLWSMIDKVRSVWEHFYKGKHDEAAPELHTIFKELAENPRRIEDYSNWETTAAHLDGEGHALPEWEHGSPSLEGYTVTELSKAPVEAGAPVTKEAVKTGPNIPYGPQALATPNSPGLLKWFEKHLGLGWYSVFANLNSRGGYLSGLAGLLVHDGAGRSAFSAAMYKRAAELELSSARAGFDNALADATGIKGWSRFIQSPQFRAKYRELSTAVREDLMRKYDAFADGMPIPVNADEQIEKLSQVYVKSGYAEKSLNFQKTAGRFGSELIDHNPYYVPMKMSSDSLRDLFRTGRANADDVKELLRLQMTKMFPGYNDAYMRQLANGIYDGIIDRGMGRSAKKPFFEGTTLDELQQAMVRAGFEPAEMQGFLERFRQHAAERKRDSTLKSRMDWDWNLTAPARNGTISMRDIVSQDLLKDLETHQRTISGQYGLGMMGFKSDSELTSAIEKALQDYSERGAGSVDLQYTRNLLDNVVDSLLGRQVGESVPPLMRASSALSSAIVLKNPVFYMSVEAAAACEKLGAARFIKNAILPSGMLDSLKGLDKQSAEELLKALEGRYVAEGRWKPILTHFDDGYDVLSSMDAAAYHVSAASRVINGTEHVRRKLTKTVLGAVISDLYRAAKGDAAKAEFMAKYGATPELLSKIKGELEKHGVDGHELKWDARTRAETEVVLMNTVDQIVQANRLGEVPAFLQFSNVGKALLPFTSFIAGAFNKVLLKGLADEDGAGLALMFAWQVAGGTLAEGLKNTSAGRSPTDSGQRNFVVRSVTNSNVASWFGLMVDSATSPQAGGAVQFAFPRALMTSVSDPSMKHFLDVTPLGVIPGINILSSMSEDKKQ